VAPPSANSSAGRELRRKNGTEYRILSLEFRQFFD